MAFARCSEGARLGTGGTQPLRSSQVRPAAPERTPRHPGGVPGLPEGVTREAYWHEVSSAGFWPRQPGFSRAAFYSYAYPEPARFRKSVPTAPRSISRTWRSSHSQRSATSRAAASPAPLASLSAAITTVQDADRYIQAAQSSNVR